MLFLCWTRHASNCFPAFHHLVQLGIFPKPVWSPVLLQLLYPQFKACMQKKNICSGDITVPPAYKKQLANRIDPWFKECAVGLWKLLISQG